MATALQQRITGKISHDNFAVKIETGATMADIEGFAAELRQTNPEALLPEIDADAITALKFSDCLPRDLAHRMLQVRAIDAPALRTLLSEPVRFVAAVP
jgi:hypothetical protein